jgi:hypothetical protein
MTVRLEIYKKKELKRETVTVTGRKSLRASAGAVSGERLAVSLSLRICCYMLRPQHA